MKKALALLAAMALSLITVTVFGASAAAHSDLQSISPADGASVEQAPSEVVLTFTDNVLGDFTQLTLRGPDGDLTLSAPVSKDNVVTQPLPPGLPAGTYSLAFRIVSADSHPIAGESTFTVTVGVRAESSGSPSTPPPSADAASSPSEDAAAPPSSPPPLIEPAPASSATGGIPWVWVIGATVAASVVGAALLARSKRRS